MGVFKKTIIDFLSSRVNLNLLQILLYILIGIVIYDYISLKQFSVVYLMIFGIHLTTQIKATADGMVYRQIMLDHKLRANDIIEKIKKQVEEDKK
tara:strand:+ start:138 stop:422 length:285 start_codon:yes stop_codon:yes gene_type:complete